MLDCDDSGEVDDPAAGAALGDAAGCDEVEAGAACDVGGVC